MRKDFVLERKYLLLEIFSVLATCIFVYIWQIQAYQSHGIATEWMSVYESRFGFRIPVYSILLGFYMAISVSACFSEYGNSSKNIMAVNLPVSVPERILSIFIMKILSVFVIYNIIFLSVDYVCMDWVRERYLHQVQLLIQKGAEGHSSRDIGFLYFKDLAEVTWSNSLMMLLSQIGIGVLFVLGSVYFTKFSFVKTAALILVFIGCIIQIQIFISVDRAKFVFVGIQNQFPPNILLSSVLALYIIALSFALYYRLKEKEV